MGQALICCSYVQEVNRVSEIVTGLADPGANVIFGAVIDQQYAGEVHVTIIATGFTRSFEDGLLAGRAGMRDRDTYKEAARMVSRVPVGATPMLAGKALAEAGSGPGAGRPSHGGWRVWS